MQHHDIELYETGLNDTTDYDSSVNIINHLNCEICHRHCHHATYQPCFCHRRIHRGCFFNYIEANNIDKCPICEYPYPTRFQTRVRNMIINIRNTNLHNTIRGSFSYITNHPEVIYQNKYVIIFLYWIVLVIIPILYNFDLEQITNIFSKKYLKNEIIYGINFIAFIFGIYVLLGSILSSPIILSKTLILQIRDRTITIKTVYRRLLLLILCQFGIHFIGLIIIRLYIEAGYINDANFFHGLSFFTYCCGLIHLLFFGICLMCLFVFFELFKYLFNYIFKYCLDEFCISNREILAGPSQTHS